MQQCHSIDSLTSTHGGLSSIMLVPATSRRRARMGGRTVKTPRRVQKRNSSVDNDIVMAGRDLRGRVTRDGELIRTTTYLDRDYPLSFRGEDLQHWMIGHSWAEDGKEAAAIAQLLLTHNVLLNVSDSRCLMVFRQCAIYRFREDQTAVSDRQSHDLEATFDNVYRKLWTDWVIRSRVVGWWIYTNTVTGQEFISWLTDNAVTETRDQAIHFASQLLLVNFFVRIYPVRTEGSTMSEFTDDDTIYQVNVCYNQTVDTATKVMHSLAHAVRLCSTETEGCMFYGKTEVPDHVQLENFEMEEVGGTQQSLRSSDPLAQTEPLPSEVDYGYYAAGGTASPTKRFLKSICQAYYPSFTSSTEETYFSYPVDGGEEEEEGGSFEIPDELFHSFNLCTYDQDDSIVIECDSGFDLPELHTPTTVEIPRPRACTQDLEPTPRDDSLKFLNTKLRF